LFLFQNAKSKQHIVLTRKFLEEESNAKQRNALPIGNEPQKSASNLSERRSNKKRKPETSIQSVLSAIGEKKTPIYRNETPKEFIETAKEKILSPFR